MALLKKPSSRTVRIAFIASSLFYLLLLFGRRDGHSPSHLIRFTQHSTATDTQTRIFPASDTISDNVLWSDFAYVQYVTNAAYLCNSVMIFEALRRHGTKAELLMMYPQEWPVPEGNEAEISYEGRLLALARDEYGAKLAPIQVKRFVNKDDPTWQDSYTKLLVWNQTQYKRVISLDSDATVLDHMDELFLLPSTPVAMPRAHWFDDFSLSSQVIVAEPSEETWLRVENAADNHEGNDYDMDILNKLFINSSMVIPHRKYNFLSGEFRKSPHGHEAYLGSRTEKWDPRKALAEAKYVHFSDWPMPKPWIAPTSKQLEETLPRCWDVEGVGEDCTDRFLWLELRDDFSKRRKRICGKSYDYVQKQLK
ncbi:Alpha-N-acetylglucosamine transferase [Pyrenophora tritici-repentis]|nr:Alpha-N-acetylglucosamine transferase [Pyrenophora tritici-repentis]